jgi:hypothetical protein
MHHLGAFCMTHLFSTVNRILQQTRGGSYFPLIALHSIYDPLQGFLIFYCTDNRSICDIESKTKQNKTRTEAMKESLQWSWCLDGVDNDSRQKLQ